MFYITRAALSYPHYCINIRCCESQNYVICTYQKTPFKHNQLEGIKKNPQNDPIALSSSSIAISFRLLFMDNHSEKKFTKKGLEKQNTTGNKRLVKGKQTFPLSPSELVN